MICLCHLLDSELCGMETDDNEDYDDDNNTNENNNKKSKDKNKVSQKEKHKDRHKDNYKDDHKAKKRRQKLIVLELLSSHLKRLSDLSYEGFSFRLKSNRKYKIQKVYSEYFVIQ